MAEIQLVIFDLDGTLVDTSEDIAASLNIAISPLGIAPLSIAETKSMVGEGLNRLLEKVLEPHGLLAHHAEMTKAFLDHYSVHLSDKSRPYPGVVEALDGLNLYGVNMAVLSNKRKELSSRLLEDLEIAHHFTLIAGSDTVPEKKPSPRAVAFVLERLGIDAHRALMVGDSTYDIEAARGAGVRSVAATWGFRPREVLLEADHLIKTIDELLPLVID